MRHVLVGGDGFVGRQLAIKLADRGETVVVADIEKTVHPIYERARYLHVDITVPEQLNQLEVGPDDIVYNVAAVMLSPIPRRYRRYVTYMPVNYFGQRNLLEYMATTGCRKMIYFSTDMVYGTTVYVPKAEDHPNFPLGAYGGSKLAAEMLCGEYRQRGFDISIFRPRLIIGPGRLGILKKLFRLIDLNLPVPMIGNGRNAYQFISVFDCVDASMVAADRGCPNTVFNLGSLNPPLVRDLLGRLIQEAGSRSFLLSTPASMVKRVLGMLDRINLPLMDPEQYLIADQLCVNDMSRAKEILDWQPRFRDDDMLLEAYWEYRRGLGESVSARKPELAG
jgi:dTDP-glucose 4,6-dehydratase